MAIVTMPKATVYKDYRLIPGQYQVGFPKKSLVM